MMKVDAFTDGSYLPTYGVGGYAAIMVSEGKTRKCVGYYTNSDCTNNKMEIRAIIRVADWLGETQKEPCEITIHTDSNYVMQCAKHQFGWLTQEGRPNRTEWIELIRKVKKYGHKLHFVKVRAHSGILNNERADKLAYEQAVKAIHVIGGK